MEPWRSAALLLAVVFLGLAYLAEWRRRHEPIVAWDRWHLAESYRLHVRAWGVLAWLGIITSLAIILGATLETIG
jgi:hypothetical protein